MTKESNARSVKKIKVSRQFSSPSEQVFDAWLDAGFVGEWLFVTPDGVMQTVELDPKVGGHFTISEQRGDTLAEHFGTFVRIERPSLLVFRYAMDKTSAQTEVAIKIQREGEGCLLTLSHDLDPEYTAYEEQAVHAWNTILSNLSAIIDP